MEASMQRSRNRNTALAAAIALAFGATSATAATIAVTSTDDNFHASTCNLRNAITSFKVGALQGSCTMTGTFGDNDTVTFAPALANSTITLARGELTIAGLVTIVGSGQTIDADYGSRVMYLNHAIVTASDLTLTHGYAGGTGRGANGAGMYLYNANATLTGVTISHNFALGDGGGINLQNGFMSLSQSKVSGNTSVTSTGGIPAYGTVVISDSVVSGNSGARTGGIAVSSGYSGGYGYGSTIGSNVTIIRSTIDGNRSACTGGPCTGGLYANLGNFITISESTISGNTATGPVDLVAGGIYVNDAQLNIVNSTMVQNSAHGDNFVSGGMSLSGADYGNSLITNTTISANNAISYNAGAYVRSGVLLAYGGTTSVQLRNSIIAGNANGTDVGVSGSSNVMTACVAGTSANVAPFNTDPTNRFSDAPGLGPLQANGGPTQTMALLVGSIAIDAGNNAFSSTTYDQRGPGFPRMFGAAVDAGAVEFQGERIFTNGFEPGP
jgi:hypothetical protein